MICVRAPWSRSWKRCSDVGYDIKVYDPDVRLSHLRGGNRSYIDQHLPHLARLLVEDLNEVYEHASLLVLGTDVADRIEGGQDFPGEVLDLRRDLVVFSPPPAAPLVVAGQGQPLTESTVQ